MNKDIITAALKASGHYYDFDTNTLYISPAFEKKSNTYGTNEYRLMNTLLEQYTDVQLTVFKGKGRSLMTYEMMEEFISIMPDAAANYAEYKRIKLQSHAYRSSYKFVAEWFKKKFPNYTKLLVEDADGKLSWDALVDYAKAQSEAAAKAEEEQSATTAQAESESNETTEVEHVTNDHTEVAA